MDSKRKANGAASPENDDRASKRRKLVEEFDLAKGESPESTTAYGMAFLEQIRRTADKSGRRVAGYFEKLPPKEGNADYYKQTRMPISLEIIEQKLLDGKFENLSELESYLKRMISNAKEFYPRSSSTFDDAERVRKAVSNYMTKTNPAYQNRRYQAVPTPLPPEDGVVQQVAEDDDEDAEGEDAEGEEDNESEEDEEEEEDDGNEENEADEDEDDVGPRSGKRSIILKRRGPGRPPRRSTANAQDTPKKSAANDDLYEGTDYKGLSFQQAQEKIVEELLRHQEPEYDSAYFEPFVNLPPRALKDYYKMVSDPLSLKKLQKIVRGVQGRGNPTGVTEFKSWAQFEEKSKLLWTNAYFYNEEGSDIYVLAQELETFFYDQLKQATAVVPEPVQPKIKLKVGQQSDQAPSAKKITLHVGGSRGESVDSPIASAGVESPVPETNGTANLTAVDKTRAISASVASSSPSVQPQAKGDDTAQLSPSVRPPSATSGQLTPGGARPPIPNIPSQPPNYVPVPTTPMEQKRFRGAGKGIENALLSRVRLQTFQGMSTESPSTVTVLPHPKEMQQSATINVPHTHHRVTLTVLLPDFLQERQYSLWTLMNKQPMKPTHLPHPSQLSQERVFDALLHQGTNVFETHLVAAIPQHERVPGGPEIELEIFTVIVNVMRN